MTVFGDQLNAVNISGIIVIFMGAFLYKVTLHLNHQRENVSADESDAEFSQVHGEDDYDNEPASPRSMKRLQKNRNKTSDPDLTLGFSVDDDLEDEDVVKGFSKTNLPRRSSPKTSNGNLEIDAEDEQELVLV